MMAANCLPKTQQIICIYSQIITHDFSTKRMKFLLDSFASQYSKTLFSYIISRLN